MAESAPSVAGAQTKPLLGLALGGGGALGAAHVGVLKALAEHGVMPRVVTGTSAGALVGAAYAAHLPIRRIEQVVRAADWSTFGSLRPTPRLGLLDSAALLTTIDRLGGEPDIGDLPRRFAAVATDLRTREQVVLSTGPLGRALRASIAVPGVFSPVVVDGRILVDGGLSANLPIEAAQDLGATYTIAVRLRPEWDRLPGTRSPGRITALERTPGVLTIRPDVHGYSQWSRADVPRIIDAGYEAACAALAQERSSQRHAA